MPRLQSRVDHNSVLFMLSNFEPERSCMRVRHNVQMQRNQMVDKSIMCKYIQMYNSWTTHKKTLPVHPLKIVLELANFVFLRVYAFMAVQKLIFKLKLICYPRHYLDRKQVMWCSVDVLFVHAFGVDVLAKVLSGVSKTWWTGWDSRCLLTLAQSSTISCVSPLGISPSGLHNTMQHWDSFVRDCWMNCSWDFM